MKKITIKNLPISERPYEKLLNYGVSMLSDAELLAVVIKCGTKDLTAIDIAQKILLLAQDSSISNISKLEIEELKQIKGIGTVKAIQIQAVIELAKRISRPNKNVKNRIKSALDVYNLLKYECINEGKEKIFIVNLNIKYEIIKISKLASGGQAKVNISMKEMFSEPVKIMSDAIIIVHNHPSGDTTPSKADIEFTFKAIETGNLLNIEVLDHIVISNKEYTSMKEKGIV